MVGVEVLSVLKKKQREKMEKIMLGVFYKMSIRGAEKERYILRYGNI